MVEVMDQQQQVEQVEQHHIPLLGVMLQQQQALQV